MVTVLKQILRLIFFSMTLLGVMVTNVFALDKMASQQFLSSCQSDKIRTHSLSLNTDRANCHAFIQGFLASTEKFTLSDEQNPTFEQRALQTRAGGQILNKGITERNPYCFPRQTTLDDIVTKINSEVALDSQEVVRSNVSLKHAEDVLVLVLKKHFSCNES